MFQVPLVTSSTYLTPAKFWEVVMLYHDRSHLVNRKLAAVSQILFYKITFESKAIQHVSELFARASLLYEVRRLKELTKECITGDFIKAVVECHDKNIVLTEMSINDFKNDCSSVVISIRILIPRNKNAQKCLEAVVLDKEKNSAVFSAVMEFEQTVLAPPFLYQIELTSSHNLRINLTNFEDADTAHAEWIATKLFPKLLKWSQNCEKKDEVSSLTLIPVDDYCSTYADLKQRYGADLIREWPNKSSTNPQKYIFEDIAIASYLISLWKDYPKDKISFVDCGCGNGLLVFILNQEGYQGYGVDVRRRPTWDIYPKETRLEVGTITSSSVFPDSTWIIGNHSDELTPWIPIMALRSSPNTNFFVLPCCPYDFSGQKYIRTNTSVSQYSDYFAYIRKICEMCGFDTKPDKLRIPSTKRTCLVGTRRKSSYQDLARINEEINKFINSRLSSAGMKLRCEFEKVRNCTQLSRDLIEKIVLTCVKNLLDKENLIEKTNGDYWNKGTSLSILELSQMIVSDDLKQLKKECGGLQTLFRNHRYLFEIKDCKVHLRVPLSLAESTKYKDKPCWFLKHHPGGCLHNAENCAYKH
ncbi:hypothetical protein NQ318_003688 [Aromia moschata]|uniref:tRNA (uracil-O(2)-)-methyltransferase n=1 Tax=Aromia moschata TaxID=1265417 RepID=A0AAV8YFB0_9CUCU|nr:hypothetical protein NQ318_003688 [Aromia moschata]